MKLTDEERQRLVRGGFDHPVARCERCVTDYRFSQIGYDPLRSRSDPMLHGLVLRWRSAELVQRGRRTRCRREELLRRRAGL